MKKLILFLVISLLYSCGKKKEKEEECEVKANDGQTYSCENLASPLMPVTGYLDYDPITGLPNQALTFETNLTLRNFDSDQKDKILSASELIQKVIATVEFKEAVLNHTFNGKRTFVDNGGLTNLQIYEKIIQGAEGLRPYINNALDADLKLYHEDNSTIGYTYPDSRMIWLNLKYFEVRTPTKVSGTLFHEWLHKLGFTHSATYNESRRYSVPYSIGYIIDRLAATL